MSDGAQGGVVDLASNLETLYVCCSRRFQQLVARQGFLPPLQPLLQAGLGIFLELAGLQFIEQGGVELLDDLLRSGKTGIEINRPE